MELKVYKDTVTAAESICDTKLELPVETEMLIPDYLPQVFKIVKCFVYLVVLQKQVTAGRLTVDGYITSPKGTKVCVRRNKSCRSQNRWM